MSVYHLRSVLPTNNNSDVGTVEEAEDQDGLVLVDLDDTETEPEIIDIHPASDRVSGQVNHDLNYYVREKY